MHVFVIILGIFFSIFSCLVLSYISMATMVGPWIAPTIILLSHVALKILHRSSSEKNTQHNLAVIQAISAGGGILATGIGFSLPTLYFLDETTFQAWLAHPLYFCCIIAALCLTAGSLGMYVGPYLARKLIDKQQLPFPVSNLNYHLITSQEHPQQTSLLSAGIAGTSILCLLRDGFGSFKGLIAKNFYVWPSVLGHELGISIWPTLWAIGFTVGTSITIPLCIGMVCKYLVLLPLARHADYSPIKLFASMSPESFAIAFCSGIVVSELLTSLWIYTKKGTKAAIRYQQHGWIVIISNLAYKSLSLIQIITQSLTSLTKVEHTSNYILRMVPLALGLGGSIALLSYFSFSLAANILLIMFTIMATYYICQLGGEIGMIPFGRFSTFIVIPLLLLFKLGAIQATIACVFFNICAAVASDLLFDYKVGDLFALERKKMYTYQWIGLITSALCMGLILWLLFTNLQLGSEALFAQRGKAKALLIQSLFFDKYIVGLGILFGLVLKRFKVNPAMVFGGLIMPNSVTIGLTLGSIATRFTNRTAYFQPLCAGILAAESLWIVISIVSAMF